MKTPVMFRVFRELPHDVLALFLSEPGTNDPSTCSSYQHIGQHGSANPLHCIRATRPARPEEYADLQRELTQRGYDLQIVQRYRGSHVKARLAELQRTTIAQDER